MKKNFWNKRIPSLLGLLFLAISIGIVSWFGKNYTQLRSKASVGETPGSVKISNITDTSFTVSYTTQDRVTGVISYGRTAKFGQVGLDDRDRVGGKPSARNVHYITVSGLDPGTKYYFALQSGGVEFLNNNLPYEATTATPLSESAPDAISVRGNVNLQDGTIPMDAVIYLSTSASQLLSFPLKNDGSYVLSVSSLRTSDLTGYVTLESSTIMRMIIQNELGQSNVSFKVANTDPVPVVTLSKDYDFAIDTSLTGLTASESAQASESGALSPLSSSGFPLFSDKISSEPSIQTPTEAESFIDPKPLFHGTAAPNALVVIIIESTQEIRTSVEADDLGNWQFRPDIALSPGQHSITILALDTSGIEHTVKRSFTVFAQGSQFTEPSISPTFTPAPTAPVSPALPTVPPAPTPTSTIAPTPTSTPTFIPSPTVLPTTAPAITTIPTSPPVPPPGSSSLFIGGALAVLSLAAGFMLFFLL